MGVAIRKSPTSTDRSLLLLFPLGLRPKRTLRLVLWTAEEQGALGASQYYQLHKVKTSSICTISRVNVNIVSLIDALNLKAFYDTIYHYMRRV